MTIKNKYEIETQVMVGGYGKITVKHNDEQTEIIKTTKSFYEALCPIFTGMSFEEYLDSIIKRG